MDEIKQELNNIKNLESALFFGRSSEVWGVVNDSTIDYKSGYITTTRGACTYNVYISEQGAEVRRADKSAGEKLNDRAGALLLAAIETIDRERWGAVRVFYSRDCAKWGVQEWTQQANGGRGWVQIDPKKASGEAYTKSKGVAERWAREIALKYRRALLLSPWLIMGAWEVQRRAKK